MSVCRNRTGTIMKREILTGIGMLLAVSSAAYAQPAKTGPAEPEAKVIPVNAASTTPATPAKAASMQHQLSENLTKAGYTYVKVMPEAFIVEAKNKSGEAVTMFLSPDSMTVFTAENAKGEDAQTATGSPHAGGTVK